MNTVLMVVEDKSFILAIRNYFLYMKFSVQVISIHKPYRIRNRASDLILLSAGKHHRLISELKKIQHQVPRVKMLYLAASEPAKLRAAISGCGAAFMRERVNLFRIYKWVERLRKKP
ncbi:MAG: hypothetical protein Q8P45_01175 [Candidatus Harrisonbacteria bacterium]|nr:hypothetical protein [Candidatus Harrisonbacteria bacterium]